MRKFISICVLAIVAVIFGFNMNHASSSNLSLKDLTMIAMADAETGNTTACAKDFTSGCMLKAGYTCTYLKSDGTCKTTDSGYDEENQDYTCR